MKKILLILMFVFSTISLVLGAGDTYTLTNLNVVLQNQDPNPAEPGDVVELRWLVENIGVSKVPGLEFMIEPEYPFSLVSGSQTQYIGTLNAKEQGKDFAVIYYKLRIDKGAIPGDYNVKLRYQTSGADGWQKPLSFKVSVKTERSLLNIKNIRTEPERLKPGSSGKLYLTLANEGKSNLQDLFLRLTLDNTHFSTIGSTDEQLINSLDAGMEQEMMYTILVSAHADAKEYKIPLVLDYSDQSGKKSTKQNTITIVLDSTPDYILTLEDTSVFTKRQKGKVVFSLSNTGSSNINFATISLEETNDYKVISKSSEYLGNLESDDFETAEFTIYTDDVKNEIPLKVVFTYKDNYNQAYTEKFTIPLKIYSPYTAKKLGLVASKSSIGLFVVILIVIAVGIYYYRKRSALQTRRLG
ncbi:hypothetical protein HYY69_06150 [Candidatus Woesearchaeota archaeon]|nr:hypothetical protein [Candidatus Woesearchaeota archaeon]